MATKHTIRLTSIPHAGFRVSVYTEYVPSGLYSAEIVHDYNSAVQSICELVDALMHDDEGSDITIQYIVA